MLVVAAGCTCSPLSTAVGVIHWCRLAKSICHDGRMSQSSSDVHRLPLLEQSWRSVVDDAVSPESLTPVVIVALGSPTNYWPTLAVGWLEDGFPVDAAIAEALRSLQERRSIAQRTRHRALRLVKAYLRSTVDA